MASKVTKITKKDLAKQLGVSRASLYYQPKQPAKDEAIKREIEYVMANNPAYGHKRIATELKKNKKCILRVMKHYGLKPYKRRIRPPTKEEDQNKPAALYSNLIKDFCPIRPHVVWVADFTYLEYQDRFIYLATVMDLFTREILGWNVSQWHNQELVLGALTMGFGRTKDQPCYHHSDQGSEYESHAYINQLTERRIQISMSKKGSPWENGFQESFYSQFKVDLGRTDQFESLGELVEAIHLAMAYYNTKRIHTALKMPPVVFKQTFLCRQRV
jgi:putative transposase